MRAAGERVTLSHVAARAGVSRATASLVLRGSPLVAEETRRRVLATMQQLGYVYHRAAASLRTQRTQTVALVINDISNPFFAALAMGVEAQLDQANHLMVLGNTAEALPKQERLLATMHEYNADGVLLCPAEGTTTETLDRLHRWGLPVALLVRYLAGGAADYAGADNVLGARLGTGHLIAHGHRRIAFAGGPPQSSARRDRLQGYAAAMGEAGLPLDPALQPVSAPTRDGGRQAILGLRALPDPPTAVLCYNDVVALGVMRGLHADHGQIPGRDVAVVGFDDIAEAALWQPPLTTLAIAPQQIGAAAAQLLLDRIAKPDQPPRQIVLPPRLVVRASCGAHPQQEGSP